MKLDILPPWLTNSQAMSGQTEKAVVLLSNDLSHPALSNQQYSFSWRINRLRPLLKRGRVVIVVAAGGAVGRNGRPTLSNLKHPIRNDGRVVMISPPILRIPMLWLIQSMIITPMMVLLYCRRNRIEVEAIVAASVPYGAVGKVLNRFLNTVLIVDYGDPDFARERSIALRVLLFLETYVLGAEGVDAVTCIDPNICEYVKRYHVRKIVFLPPGGFWKDLSPQPVVGDSAEQRVVYAGHVAPPPAYRLDLLFEAAPMILAKNPKARIVIVGDGEYLPVLRKRFADLKLLDRVEMTGGLPYEGAKAQIANASVALQLLNDMCLGTKVVDYFAMGRAVVASGSFYDNYTEFLLNGKNCLLVPPSPDRLADAVCSLLEDDDLRKRLGVEAFETVQEYDWDSQADVLLRLVSEGQSGRTG
jgi:glycosyltransferase involved in cell wall biosynthesis